LNALLKAAIDLGAAGFGTAEMNAVSLGKALNDPIKGISALTRNGITFTESEKERIKVLVESNKVGEAQNMILQAIETQVGGTAEATANATDRMKVGFTQVQERIGLALLPVLDKFTTFMLDKLFPAFEEYVAPAVQRLVDLFSSDSGGLGNSFNKIIEVVKSFVLPIFTGITKVFQKVGDAIKNNIDVFKDFFDIVKALAPIIGKTIGGALSVVGDIAKVVINIIGTVLSAIKPLINTFIDGINLVIKGLNLVRGVNITPLRKLGDSAGSSGGLSAGLYGSTPALGSASQIANSQTAVAGAISGFTSSMGTGGAGGTTKTPKVSAPKFVTPVGLPAFDPKAYDSSLTRTESNIYNVTVNGAVDPESTARQIVTILNDSQARGTLGASGLVGAVTF
jgi:phage-related protein